MIVYLLFILPKIRGDLLVLKHKIFLFSGLIGWMMCVVTPVSAQDPQFSQYYAAPLYLNPGLTGINQLGRAGVNYRNQWPSLPVGFETYSFFVDYNFEDYNSSVGLIVNTDQEGRVGLRSTSVGLIYAYEARLNDRWTFRPGIQASYYQRDLNFANLTFGDQFDNTGQIRNVTQEDIGGGLSARFMDFSAGGIIYNPDVWIGLSMHHISEPNQSIAGGEAPLSRKVSLHGGYRFNFSDFGPIRAKSDRERSFTPTFNYKAQGDFDQLDLGVYFTLEPIIFGLWYRGIPIKTFRGIASNEAIVVMTGITAGKTTIGYSFDYTISNLTIGTGGAHEISLTYQFSFADPRKPPREIREIRCPVPFIF
ncbi:MAG: type IX secretion system PorP/SprF family membrane protein [Cyclobacteriaceae bacterium]